MALVELLQPTNMGALTGSSGLGSDEAAVSSFNLLDPGRYISLTGSGFSYATNDVLNGGIVGAAAIDTADPDLIPDILFLNLSYSANDIFGQELYSDMFAVVENLMAGDDKVIGSN